MRTVFYGDELCSILNRYVKARGGVPADTILESYVDKGKPLSVRGIQHIVRQIVRRAGIKKRVSPHTLLYLRVIRGHTPFFAASATVAPVGISSADIGDDTGLPHGYHGGTY